MSVNPAFQPILDKIYKAYDIDTEDIREIRQHAQDWKHNTRDYPCPNKTVVKLCDEILKWRGEE